MIQVICIGQLSHTRQVMYVTPSSDVCDWLDTMYNQIYFELYTLKGFYADDNLADPRVMRFPLLS